MKVEDSRQSSDDSLINNQHTKSDDAANEIKTVSEEETLNCIQANMPYDERVKRFRQILIDNNVSAFSTWEKELHRIVFDPRYPLISSKERKKVFETYVKERLQEEKDKKSKE
ncbi:Transcription elongation regulator 1-like protein, partial [Stegodyphus mimosarum]